MLIHDGHKLQQPQHGNGAGNDEKEVAIQLYSVRDLVKDGSNLDQILKDLADMGYTSVEAANYNDGKFYGKTPQEFKQMVEKSGMTVLSSHTTHGLSDEELASGDFTEALNGGISALLPIRRPVWSIS